METTTPAALISIGYHPWMGPILDAWFVPVVALAARLNREQDKAIQYLLAENRVLKEQLKARGGRIRFTDRQRRLLAGKAKELGMEGLPEDPLGRSCGNGLLHG